MQSLLARGLDSSQYGNTYVQPRDILHKPIDNTIKSAAIRSSKRSALHGERLGPFNRVGHLHASNTLLTFSIDSRKEVTCHPDAYIRLAQKNSFEWAKNIPGFEEVTNGTCECEKHEYACCCHISPSQERVLPAYPGNRRDYE